MASWKAYDMCMSFSQMNRFYMVASKDRHNVSSISELIAQKPLCFGVSQGCLTFLSPHTSLCRDSPDNLCFSLDPSCL